MGTQGEYQKRGPREGIQVGGAPVQRGGAHKNLTVRFPEKMLADITRLAGARGASKNSVIIWALENLDLARLADMAEEHGNGTLKSSLHYLVPLRSEEWMVRMVTQRVLWECRDELLEQYRERREREEMV
jgi:hypothetical protein